MSEDDQLAAVAFRCDPRGEIREILRDDVGLPRRVQVGKPFMAAIAEAQLMDVMSALRALREQDALADLLFRVRREDDEDLELHFAARRVAEGELLVVGASTHALLEEVETVHGAADSGDPEGDEPEGDEARADRTPSSGDADGEADELLSLCRAVAARPAELERLRTEVADCLDGSSRDLARLAELLREAGAPWSDELRGRVASALDAASALVADAADDRRRG